MTPKQSEAVHILVSWPDKALSPNARVHWSTKARARRAQRDEAGWTAKATFPKFSGPVTIQCVFHPPDKRKRDLDNLLASMKAAFDGIVDAGVIAGDDSAHLRHEAPSIGDVARPPYVQITITGELAR